MLLRRFSVPVTDPDAVLPKPDQHDRQIQRPHRQRDPVPHHTAGDVTTGPAATCAINVFPSPSANGSRYAVWVHV